MTGREEMQLAGDVGFLMARTSGLMVRITNGHLAGRGLRVRHFSVLSYVCDRDGASQREIAAYLGLDPSPVVALVDALEAEGLVERLPHPGDRRARLVAPTPRGRELREQAKKDVEAARERFLERLAPEERDLLLGLLQRLAFTGDGDGAPAPGKES
ncbi:DNA-binding MarR family transcriptional regulator [Actinomadura luteofluorescens]|uniref:DNA-binding MarR family transcriptional regulator n=1 Tax=Actinomadura luteofluorescens TaxID=46163 RepID=A0A7Y9ECD2_9ACTN|nr:MarR family transcriptional regulator [Actinomadura luteofluorescens]NYD44881.1 DNA-binding MarR family transcriptional regulator [Actinomadura luteofluorescens]